MEKIQFDYYRGMEAEQYSFYRVPKILFTAECFKELSCEAKVLYGLLLDRMSLSMKNHWLDEEERVYIIFTVEEIAELLNCGTQKAVKLLKELDSEKGIGLIEKKRLGLGRPNVIYVKNFLVQKNDKENGDMPDLQNCENHNSGVVKTTIQECPKSQFKNDENHNSEDVEPIDIGTEELGKEPYLNGEKEILEDMEIKMQENEEIREENFQNCENHNSRVVKTTIQEFPKSQFKNDENHNSGVVKTTIQECPKSQSNNTDINKTENNETESSNILSNLIYPEKEKMIDEIEQRNTYREIIRENISYECFQNDTPHAREEVDELNTYGGEAKRLLEDLQSRNERMFLVTVLFLNTAKTKQELDNAVFQTAGIAQKYNCSLRRLDYMQEQGLMSSIPLGMNMIPIKRALTTTSTAIFVPFTTQELFMGGESLYYWR